MAKPGPKPKTLNKRQKKLLKNFVAEYKKFQKQRKMISAYYNGYKKEQADKKQQRQVLKELFKKAKEEGVPKNQMANAIKVTPQALIYWLESKYNKKSKK